MSKGINDKIDRIYDSFIDGTDPRRIALETDVSVNSVHRVCSLMEAAIGGADIVNDERYANLGYGLRSCIAASAKLRTADAAKPAPETEPTDPTLAELRRIRSLLCALCNALGVSEVYHV